MAENKVIKEIICLKSIVQETGRPRVLTPGDFSDGTRWERLVEAALADAASYEIKRETIYSDEEQAEDLSSIELKDMTVMSRERVAVIAEFYGIKDEGQGRATLIDQIASEKEKEAEVMRKLATKPSSKPGTPATTKTEQEVGSGKTGEGSPDDDKK